MLVRSRRLPSSPAADSDLAWAFGAGVQSTSDALMAMLKDPEATTEFDCGCWPDYKEAVMELFQAFPTDGSPIPPPASADSRRRLLNDTATLTDGMCGGIETVRFPLCLHMSHSGVATSRGLHRTDALWLVA